MLFYSICLVLLVFVTEIVSNGKVIPDDRVQVCDGPKLRHGEPAKGKIFNADIDFVITDEENVLLNGSLIAIKNVDKEWFVRITGEQLIQGDWHTRTIKVLQDPCYDLFNPLDIFYSYFKDFPQCPYEPGDAFTFVERHFSLDYIYFPPSFQGRWRIRVEVEMNEENSEKLKDCFFVYGDLEM